MCSTSIFPFIMTKILYLYFFLLRYFFFFFFYIYFFVFHYDSCCCFVKNSIFFFLKLIVYIVCSVKESENFFMESLPLYTLYLFSMLLNGNVVDIEKPDGICSVTFVEDEFAWLFLHPSIFSIIRFLIFIKF